MRQMTVSTVMTPDPIAVSPDTDFTTIVEILLSHDISAVPVVSGSGALIGVVPESDLLLEQEHAPEHDGQPVPFARKRARDRWSRAWATRAFDLMMTPVLCLDAEDSLSAAARELGRSGVRRLFVVRDGKLAGVLSCGDLLKAYARDDGDMHDEPPGSPGTYWASSRSSTPSPAAGEPTTTLP